MLYLFGIRSAKKRPKRIECAWMDVAFYGPRSLALVALCQVQNEVQIPALEARSEIYAKGPRRSQFRTD